MGEMLRKIIGNLLQAEGWDIPDLLIFLVFVLAALVIGRYTPTIVRLIVRRFAPEQVSHIYEDLIDPIRGVFRAAGTSLLLALSLIWLEADYRSLYAFLKPFIDLAVIMSLAWLASRLFRQVVRIYGIELLQRMGREADEMLLVFETLANVFIGLVAVLAFAQSQQFNVIGLVASLGISGLAVAFAANKILEQLLSTLVLYLDRPFIPGDYIRMSNGQLGRVEAIGLRSTKIRASAKNTLFIVPNSNLVNTEIENITRAKKVMVMLYLDFTQPLEEQAIALVRQAITDSTNSVFGIDPGSTSITIEPHPTGEQATTTRARITFFILGSSEDSMQLRKRLLALANETLARKLMTYGIEFLMQEPTIYVESPATL